MGQAVARFNDNSFSLVFNLAGLLRHGNHGRRTYSPGHPESRSAAHQAGRNRMGAAQQPE